MGNLFVFLVLMAEVSMGISAVLQYTDKNYPGCIAALGSMWMLGKVRRFLTED